MNYNRLLAGLSLFALSFGLATGDVKAQPALTFELRNYSASTVAWCQHEVPDLTTAFNDCYFCQPGATIMLPRNVGDTYWVYAVALRTNLSSCWQLDHADIYDVALLHTADLTESRVMIVSGESPGFNTTEYYTKAELDSLQRSMVGKTTAAGFSLGLVMCGFGWKYRLAKKVS